MQKDCRWMDASCLFPVLIVGVTGWGSTERM